MTYEELSDGLSDTGRILEESQATDPHPTADEIAVAVEEETELRYLGNYVYPRVEAVQLPEDEEEVE